MATKDNIPAIPSMRFQILAGYQRYEPVRRPTPVTPVTSG
jgi:hypothetical protein